MQFVVTFRKVDLEVLRLLARKKKHTCSVQAANSVTRKNHQPESHRGIHAQPRPSHPKSTKYNNCPLSPRILDYESIDTPSGRQAMRNALHRLNRLSESKAEKKPTETTRGCGNSSISWPHIRVVIVRKRPPPVPSSGRNSTFCT